MSAGRQRPKARCACVQTLTDPRDQSPTGLMRGVDVPPAGPESRAYRAPARLIRADSGPRLVSPVYGDGVSTHEVTNQAPPLSGYNVVSMDPALVEGIQRWGDALA